MFLKDFVKLLVISPYIWKIQEHYFRFSVTSVAIKRKHYNTTLHWMKKATAGVTTENRIMHQRFLWYFKISTLSLFHNFPKSINLPIFLIFHHFDCNIFDQIQS